MGTPDGVGLAKLTTVGLIVNKHTNSGFIRLLPAGLREQRRIAAAAEADRHLVTDVHAMILQLLALASRKLEVPSRKRLAIDHGTPIDAIVA